MKKPNVRFPEFKEEWKEKKLKDFLKFKNGLNADKDKFGSGIKYISVMDILNNPFIIYDMIRGRVDIDEKTLDNYSVTYGDVLFQRSSETREDAGKSNVYLDKENIATFGGFVIRGKKIGDYSPEFMNSLLKSQRVRREITSKAQGAQHINVGQETLENVKIIIPDIEEQKKIAEIFSRIDERISIQKQIILDLEERKKCLIQKIFNQEIRFKEEENSYPDWQTYAIGEIYSERVERSNGDEILLSVTRNDGVKKRSEIEGKDTSSEDKSNYKRVYINDMVYNSMRMWQGANGISEYDGIVSPAYTVLKANMKINYTFFAYLFKTNKLIFEFYRFSQGLTSDTWNLKYPQISKIKVSIPCYDEQVKIARCLRTFDKKIQVEKEILEIWEEIKKGLLQQMFV